MTEFEQLTLNGVAGVTNRMPAQHSRQSPHQRGNHRTVSPIQPRTRIPNDAAPPPHAATPATPHPPKLSATTLNCCVGQRVADRSGQGRARRRPGQVARTRSRLRDVADRARRPRGCDRCGCWPPDRASWHDPCVGAAPGGNVAYLRTRFRPRGVRPTQPGIDRGLAGSTPQHLIEQSDARRPHRYEVRERSTRVKVEAPAVAIYR